MQFIVCVLLTGQLMLTSLDDVQGIKLYYKVLENMLKAEEMRTGKRNFTRLLSSDNFHKCLLACSFEMVVASYRMVRTCSLTQMHLAAVGRQFCRFSQPNMLDPIACQPFANLRLCKQSGTASPNIHPCAPAGDADLPSGFGAPAAQGVRPVQADRELCEARAHPAAGAEAAPVQHRGEDAGIPGLGARVIHLPQALHGLPPRGN